MGRHRSPLTFFLLVFALSLPFFVLGALRPRELLPGLPVAGLMVVCPALAASLLVYREEGAHAVAALLRRAGDARRIPPAWYLPILLLMPGLTLLVYGWMRLAGVPLPEPRIPLVGAAGLFLVFFVSAAGEEIGWTGYTLDPLQERTGALAAALVIGLVWAAWHIIPLVQAHRAAPWIAWWGLGTVGSRVLMVWLYDNAGRSVFGAVLFHTISNLCWQLFPNAGSHYDPRRTSILVLLAAAIVVLAWRPGTPARADAGASERR
jgi:membrane protease YdiL (CAAX protease family)